ncbi:NnrU family protein [Acetobacter tropicalis]|nr:NnrU family protein [Acetobacter tropicalis]
MGVEIWTFGPVLAAGMVHDLVLFGSFLQWATMAVWLHSLLIGVPALA